MSTDKVDRMSLKITERLVGEVTVLDLNGRITLGEGTPYLRDYIGRLVSENKIKIRCELRRGGLCR